MLAALLAVGAVYGADQAVTTVIAWLRTTAPALFSPAEYFWANTQHAGLHWPIWLAAGLLAALVALLRRRAQPLDGHRTTCGLLGLGLGGLIVVLGVQMRETSRGSLLSARNFYGVLSVQEYGQEDPSTHYRLLLHGRITHGIQFVAPERARTLTSYFGSRSGSASPCGRFHASKTNASASSVSASAPSPLTASPAITCASTNLIPP